MADTGNHKLRLVTDDRVETLLGPDSGLRRPEGVTVVGETVYVASTGTDQVLRCSLDGSDCEEFVVRP